MSGSQFWTPQMLLDVAEELRTGGGPQMDFGLGAEGEKAGVELRWLPWEGESWLAQATCLMGSLDWWWPWLECREASRWEVR